MDLLQQPIVGPILRWRRLRLALQVVMLLAATAIVLHGLFGPQIAPRNLATVTTSIHWRGLLVIAILAIGNLFCTACPMVLVRDAGRQFVTPRLRWPRVLRRKWLALALLVLVLFSYELWTIWESPRATAALILAVFGLALVVDLIFKGASFCKYVCPIGQFNFVASTLSPTELRVREDAVCRSCKTSDCIRGRYTGGSAADDGMPAAAPALHVSVADDAMPVVGATPHRSAASRRPDRRGCELGLFLPAKVGNLDCTMCFDCVHACPHDNIALSTRLPGAEWLVSERRSVFGRIAGRTDVAALAIVFTFAALVSAFAMTAPASALEAWISGLSGASRAMGLLGLFLAGLLVMPAALVGTATVATRLSGAGGDLWSVARCYSFALVPLGFGVWLAHYGFHLLTGMLTIIPVTQSAAIDAFGRALLGEPAWQWMGMRSGAVFPIQLGLVVFGAAGSIGLARATAQRDSPDGGSAASAPWIVLVIAVAALAVWILAQPMDMRGTGTAG